MHVTSLFQGSIKLACMKEVDKLVIVQFSKWTGVFWEMTTTFFEGGTEEVGKSCALILTDSYI